MRKRCLSQIITLVLTASIAAVPMSAYAATTTKTIESQILSPIRGANFHENTPHHFSYSKTAGMAIDRTNHVAFLAKMGSNNEGAALWCTSSTKLANGSLSNPDVDGSDWIFIGEWLNNKKSDGTYEEDSGLLGHVNDLCVVPNGKNTYVYVVTDRANRGIVRLLINNSTKKVTETKKFDMYYSKEGVQTLRGCGSLGYSTSSGNFIARRTRISDDKSKVICCIGTFNSSKLDWTKKIYLEIGNSVKMPGKGTYNIQDWACQGMCYYKGNIYMTMANTTAGHKNETVIICYKIGSLNTVTAGKSFAPKLYAFDKVTLNTTGNDIMENECADGYNGDILFATNETANDNVRKYTEAQIAID